jgi:hypothetical protein
MKTKKALLILLAMTVLASCQKKVEYPVEPKITYEGFDYVVDDNNTLTGEGVLHIGYTDGDGDLGLDDGDTLYPFGLNDPHYYNLLIDYITPTDTFNFDARFKRLVFDDEVKAISGTIDYTMMLLNPLAPHDSIKLKIHIIDRALHESNTIESEIITF